MENHENTVNLADISFEHNKTDEWLESIFLQISDSHKTKYSSRPIFIEIDPNLTSINQDFLPYLLTQVKDQITSGKTKKHSSIAKYLKHKRMYFFLKNLICFQRN